MARVHLRTFLDAGVPDSVGRVLSENGHTVILHREALAEGTPDELVCATALLNNAIFIAIDGDMKRLARPYGIMPKGDRFNQLSLIRLCCNETIAAKRLAQAISLIEHEWTFSTQKASRRLWIDIAQHFIRSNR